MVQWLRISLAIQRTLVWSLIQEDPTCHGATKSERHNYRASVPHSLSSETEKPLQWELLALHRRVASSCHNKRKPVCSNEDPGQPKINTFLKSWLRESFHCSYEKSKPIKTQQTKTWCCHAHYFLSREVLVWKTVGDEKESAGAKC